jgi:tyrocidine synthetase-3
MQQLHKENIQDILALSPMQSGILYHYLEDPVSPYYFEQLSLEIEGQISLQRFERAWDFVVDANEMLRTVFRWEKLETPTQVVLKTHPLDWRFEDLADIGDSLEQRNQWETIKQQDRSRQFDLQDVPFRVILGKMAHSRYHMLISNHHILYDGWSTGIILKEFLQAYETLAMGNQPLVPLVKTEFKEFIQWHREQDRQEQKKYWQHYLGGFDTPSRLPNKRSKPGPVSRGERNYRLHLSHTIKDKLELFVKDRRITLAAFFHCAWGVLLQKYCGMEDVVFGITVSGRSVPIRGIENMVGLFINTVPLRAGAEPGENWADFLVRINNHLAAGEKYENTPLVDIYSYCRQSTHVGEELFDTLVSLENYPLDTYLREPGSHLTIRSYTMEEMPHYDLTLVISTAESIDFDFIYKNTSLAEDTIVRLAQHFSTILKGIAENVENRPQEIEILPEKEKQQLLVDFNRTAADYPGDKTIYELFAGQVERTPDSIALVGPHQVKDRTDGTYMSYISYRELTENAGQLAYKFIEKGVRPDSIVGIMMERSIAMVVGILGILKAGGAYLPIDPEFPEERRKYILEDSKVRILVKKSKNISNFVPGEGFHVISIDDISRDSPSPQALLNLSEGHNFTNDQCPMTNDQLAYIIYTSGSTGKPKGVMVEQSSVVNLLWAMQRRYPLTDKDTYLLKTSYLFDVSVTELFGWFLEGGRLAVLEPGGEKDPKAILDMMVRQGVTHINFVPSMFHTFVEILEPGDIPKLGSLKYIFLAGEALLAGPVNRFRRFNISTAIENIYGPTEAAVYASWFSLAGWKGESSIPIGKPLPNVKLYIFDKWGSLQPIEVPGELCIGGVGLARGYLNKPGLTAEKFNQDLWDSQDEKVPGKKSYMCLEGTRGLAPLSGKNHMQSCNHAAMPSSHLPISPSPHSLIYHTGDLARWLPGGNIEFLGRMDFQVKVRGFRIELGEIEYRLVSHPGIKSAVVVVKTDEAGNNDLCAYIVSGNELPVPGLDDYLSKYLPGYMVPTYFIWLDKIPLTSSGKVDRKALPTPGIKSREGYAAPGNRIEEKLVEIWAGVLGIEKEKIGINDNFFHLGGHSLKATLLAARIHKELKVNVPLPVIFKKTRIRGLAEFIKDAETQRFSSIGAAEKKDYYILSSGQRRLLVLQQMDERGIAYNMPSVWQLEGDLDREKFAAVFQQLIQRHESLRTSFHMVNEEPVQRIKKETVIGHWSLGIGEVGESEIEDRIKNFIKPFDLSRAPLLRVGLIEFPHTPSAPRSHPSGTLPTPSALRSHPSREGRRILMVDMHHIISDGMSMGILVKEFMELYAGKGLPVLRLQYKDYSEWQKKQVLEKHLKQQETYWLKEFSGEIAVLDLPTDYPRPLVQDFFGGSISFEIGAEETNALKSLADEQGVTRFMLLLSLYTVCLSRLSGQEDIVVGTPIAGRRHADLQSLIGILVNTLVLRYFPLGPKPFTQFLQEVKESTVKAFENQDYLYEDLVEKVDLQRDTGRNPLFDTMFSLQDFDALIIEIPGLKVQPLDSETRMSKFDLTLTAVEKEENLLFIFEYRTRLFKQETIRRFIGYFRKIISTVLGCHDIRISRIEIIDEKEKNRILNEFNDTTAEYPKYKTIYRLFEDQVERTPDNIAVIGPLPVKYRTYMTYISYRELKEKIGQLAYKLIEKGGQPDTIVGIMMERSIDMVIGILGILKSGSAYMPIDPDYPPERINYMLKDSNVGILVSTPKLQVKVKAEVKVINLPYAIEPSPSTSTSTLTSTCQVSHTNLAYIIYTSGSTGRPKGVLVEQSPVVNLLWAMQRRYPLKDRDTYLLKTSYLFDVSVTELFGWFLQGGRLAVLEPGGERDPKTILDMIGREGVTHINFVPSMFSTFVEILEPGDIAKLAGLKYIFLAGEALPAGPVKQFRTLKTSIAIENIYGPTEAVVYASWFSLVEWDGESSIPIGKPLTNVKFYILDKWGNLQPIAVAGELCISGVCLARGYLNNPELTAGKFKRAVNSHSKPSTNDQCPMTNDRSSKRYHTGDLVRWLSDGNIEFLRRIDHQVKIRGFRVELGEIENHLLTHGKIKEAVVLARQDNNDKYLCAYIVAQSNETNPIDAPEIREYLSHRLPGYMIPSYFVQLDHIPLTPNGKVDRKALPEPEMKTGQNYIAPGNELEEKLVDLWSEILNVEKEKISINDNFFHLGGHSLKATILSARIHKELKVNVPLAEIFKTSHIRGLAAYIGKHRRSAVTSAPIRPIEKKEYFELSHGQAGMWMMSQLPGGAVMFNIFTACTLRGLVDEGLLARAFQALVNRHESLRTIFITVDDHPGQKVLPPGQSGFQLEISDWRGREDREPGINHLVHTGVNTLFDLSVGPLIKAMLVRVDHQHYIFFIILHHIISDAHSMEIMVSEVFKFYEGDKPGEEGVFAPMRIQYKDFAAWQARQMQQGIFNRHRQYWQRQLASPLPRLELPWDKERPQVMTYNGDTVKLHFDESTVKKLALLSRQYEVTLFMLLTAALNVLFYQVTGQTDIILGTPALARGHENLQKQVGLYINTVVIRTIFSPGDPFTGMLEKVKQVTLKSLENQEYPFDRLVEDLGIERDPARHPLFDVMVDMIDMKPMKETLNRPDLDISPYGDVPRKAKFDLTIYIFEYSDSLEVEFDYNTDLFASETIEYTTECYERIIDSIIEKPGECISDLAVEPGPVFSPIQAVPGRKD